MHCDDDDGISSSNLHTIALHNLEELSCCQLADELLI